MKNSKKISLLCRNWESNLQCPFFIDIFSILTIGSSVQNKKVNVTVITNINSNILQDIPTNKTIGSSCKPLHAPKHSRLNVINLFKDEFDNFLNTKVRKLIKITAINNQQ